MSLNYADALKPYDNKGVLGIPERFDAPEEIEEKAKQLAEWIRAAKCCVLHTGAGISTTAGIADFRGPNGVWTLEAKKQKAESVNFEEAIPTFTHFAINALEKAGFVKFVVSQNVDGLHIRSGFPVDRLAEVHGNIFAEKCNRCFKRFYRNHVVGTVGFKLTGKPCEAGRTGRSCRGQLTDFALDWDDELPEPDFKLSQQYAGAADLSISLGTTLQIKPAGNLPLLAKKNRGHFVSINLQDTAHEKKADLSIRGKCDEVMTHVMNHLGITVNDPRCIITTPTLNSVHPVDKSLLTPKKRKRTSKQVESGRETTEDGVDKSGGGGGNGNTGNGEEKSGESDSKK
ncbi:hypothetical protein L596_018213 [Steinernema carpocapsae]|uniref:protein acetyllysine N-acetyltransferase n=1 Tax=Steinernema carpocapsae TaxID=34508 RepID=A0A4U5N4A8_STECR|nr:hypothetical protein L596_018213 [Steinernema carpocapsae]